MTGTDQIRKGRLGGDRSNAVAEFLSSAAADRRIAYCDLRVDMAHQLTGVLPTVIFVWTWHIF